MLFLFGFEGIPLVSVDKYKEMANVKPVVLIDLPEVTMTLTVLQSISQFAKENFWKENGPSFTSPEAVIPKLKNSKKNLILEINKNKASSHD